MANKRKKTSSSSSLVTEASVCEAFVRRFHNDYRYVVTYSRFVMKTGRAWDLCREMDAYHQVYASVLKLCKEMSVDDPDVGKRIQSNRFVKNCLEMLQNDERIRVNDAQFHTNPEELVTKSGIVCLRTGALLPEPENGVPPSVGWIDYDYEPNPPDPVRFLAFLQEMFQGNSAQIEYLQTLLGYCLTGYSREEKLPVFYGVGGNGKGTLFKVIHRVFSQYAIVMDASTLDRPQGGPSPELTRIREKRLILIHELSPNSFSSSALIKSLTGGDAIATRGLYQDTEEFIPRATLMVSCNTLPSIKNYGHDWERRIEPFPCESIPATPDVKLKDAMVAECGGVLHWVIEGAKRYLATGLPANPVREDAMPTFRESVSLPAGWFSSCLRRGQEEEFVWNEDLRASYRQYCTEQGYSGQVDTEVFTYLRRQGFKSDKKKGARGWYGLAILDPELDREDVSILPPLLPLPMSPSLDRKDVPDK